MKLGSSLRYALGSVFAAGCVYALLPKAKRLEAGQVVLITGGSRGLGLALAHRFGQAGCKLALAARHQEQLEEARQELLSSGSVADAGSILLLPGDVGSAQDAAGLVEATLRLFGKLDVLINNAGIIEVGALEDQPLEAYERSMAIDFFGALYTTYAALPHMLGRKAGSIVNISSIGGKVAVPHLLPYVASKFALTGFSEGLHAELRSKGIVVTTVCPGLLRTGGEVYAHFHGQIEKEKAWFQTSDRTPGLAAEVQGTANRIFHAVNRGKAEIIITPQAWIAARFAGLAPETTQWLAALANEHVLPAPLAAAPQPPASLLT